MHEPDAGASATDVGSVRRMLDVQQIMDTDEFDRWLDQADPEHETTKAG